MKISVYRSKQLRTSFPSICIFQRLHGRKAPLWDPHFSLPTVIRIRSVQFGQPFEKFPTRSFFLESLKRIIHVQPIVEIVETPGERRKEKKREENDSMKRFKFFFIKLMNIYVSTKKNIYYKRCTECKGIKN